MTGVSKGVLSHVVYSMLLHGRHGKVLLYDACHGMVMPRHVNCDMSLVSPHGMRRGQYECCQVFNANDIYVLCEGCALFTDVSSRELQRSLSVV